MVLSLAYSSALVSFFSVSVYPHPPRTFDEMAVKVQKENLKVQICCEHMEAVMKASHMESFKIMTEPGRV